ncbi:MAG: hypothetical protein HYU57_06235 [Micavibrio aeruginosavorus]|nr:hypothetical protein [Micavibrio aeruginosavorus]
MPHHIVSATFNDRHSAESVLSRLEKSGITKNQISLLVTDIGRGRHFGIDEHSKMDKGIAAGATAGGVVGAVIGALMAASVIVVPGINLVVAGSLASGLAGFGAGVAAGGLVGALIGAGIPEHEARIYEKELKSGNVLLAVDTLSDEQKRHVKEILQKSDAMHIAA